MTYLIGVHLKYPAGVYLVPDWRVPHECVLSRNLDIPKERAQAIIE